jgi:hypothetical protein
MRVGSAEFDLLCLAARPRPDFAKIRERLRVGVDVDVVMELAAQHGVRPNLLQALSRLSWDQVPARMREGLERFQHGHLLRALSVSNELIGLAAGFSDCGIDFAAFKGPVLAMQLYGDVALREYADIDIIVPPAQMDRAERVLFARGYRNTQGDQAFRRAFLRHQRQYAFVRDDVDAAVDLHWDFSAELLPFPVHAAEIWSALKPVVIGGVDIPSLAGADLVLLLAGHGTKEAWRSVGWVCDFATLVERLPDLDWSSLHARARRNGSGCSILLAAAMARELLDQPAAPFLAAALDRNPGILDLARELAGRLRSAFPADIERANLEDLMLCDRLGDRILASTKIAMTPTPGDYHALPLPAALWPTYRLTRPVRLAAGAVWRVFSRQGTR